MKSILIYLTPEKSKGAVYHIQPSEQFAGDWKKVIESVNNGVNFGIKYL
jgi:hypothetical protein